MDNSDLSSCILYRSEKSFLCLLRSPKWIKWLLIDRIRWALGNNQPPRDLRVIQAEPNSPAANAGFNSGDKVLEIDGVDLINGSDVNTLNAGLSPSTDGETHVFKVQDVFGVEKTLSVRE